MAGGHKKLSLRPGVSCLPGSSPIGSRFDSCRCSMPKGKASRSNPLSETPRRICGNHCFLLEGVVRPLHCYFGHLHHKQKPTPESNPLSASGSPSFYFPYFATRTAVNSALRNSFDRCTAISAIFTKKEAHPYGWVFFLVEMVGIEPTSEKASPRLSTSVAFRLGFPPPGAEKQAPGFGSLLSRGRAKGGAPAHVHRSSTLLSRPRCSG